MHKYLCCASLITGVLFLASNNFTKKNLPTCEYVINYCIGLTGVVSFPTENFAQVSC